MIYDDQGFLAAYVSIPNMNKIRITTLLLIGYHRKLLPKYYSTCDSMICNDLILCFVNIIILW